MNFLFDHEYALEKRFACAQKNFDYNCSKFLVQEFDLRQQIDEAKRLLESLNKVSIAYLLGKAP